MFTVNHQYRVHVIRHDDVFDDLNVLVVIIESSSFSIGNHPYGRQMDFVIYDSSEDRLAILRAERHKIPAP